MADRFGIVVGTKAAAQAICDVIDRELGYPRVDVGARNGKVVTTETHAAPYKHPTLANRWAVLIDDAAGRVVYAAWKRRTNLPDFTVTRLGEDWFPTPTNPF
jgi:hypothetical protein